MSLNRSQERLLREYPALDDVYQEVLEIASVGEPAINVRMRVRRGDPTLMYWHPTHSAADRFSNGMESPHLQGLRYEQRSEVFMYDDRGKRVHGRGVQSYSVQDLGFLRLRFNSLQRTTPLSCLAYIIVVDSELWHSGSRGAVKGDRLTEGRFTFTLYKSPAEGWRELAARTDVFRNVCLSGQNLVTIPCPDEHWYRELVRVVGEQAHKFEGLAWNRGVGRLGEGRGLFGDVSVSVQVGVRPYIELERAGVYFSMVCFPASVSVTNRPVLGFSGIEGTLDDVDQMLNVAIAWWLTADEEARKRAFA